ncbi:MAG: glycoside hydrolase family 88 protein [Bacteroidaceae bacterium]|nr:glycoside hydrolase family 88 protein [Bacteroidaceae bacterium]MBQ4462370.1 glycoside hydrolase family 88 protein [Bacteroidaceae bacterium]MBQ7483604.1 glycoside hydrolase family 88 protein [Bacteroidaceae bacterium]
MNKKLIAVACVAQLACANIAAQNAEPVNDMTTPLHLLKPNYRVTYGELEAKDVKATLDRIFAYIDAQTPARLVKDGKEIGKVKKLPEGAALDRGAFRIGSYEWGITYQALIDASAITGDAKYKNYVTRRFDFLKNMYPLFKPLSGKVKDAQMEQIINPRALDDCGTMCTAMMKAGKKLGTKGLDSLVENYFRFIEKKQYRLSDGTFARHRPQRNTIWLDDMYMGIPAVAYRGVYTGDAKYFDEAATMYRHFVERMWLPEKGIYRHGYVEGLNQQPTYHWARANGWALLTTVELLDMLPKNHKDRDFVLNQLRLHVKGLAALQSMDGFWHQLLDRNDSYLETSATAIYTYCIAHAVNEGWIDGITYGPVAQLGWHAVNSKVTPEGLVAGTCVGTGMAFDPAFYYYRPVSAAAAHGYGPTLWAAAEMIRLLDKWHPRTNDSGLHYYEQKQTCPNPLFYLTEDGKGEEVVF